MTNIKATVSDIIMLMKPRIILLLVITCAGGALVATKGNMDILYLDKIILTLIGLTFSAGGANMVNMWYDQDIDAVMERTKHRPLPSGRMHSRTVLALGIAFGVLSTVFLWVLVNPTTALMALSGYLFYVFIYTMLLKRRTVQNIVIGGAAGAFPPLVGWAAVQNSVMDFLPWAMFAVIFLWTPPHFWALALRVNADYTKAKIPMMPVVKGVDETKTQILYYMLILMPVTLAMAFFPPMGLLYLLAAAVLGIMWAFKGVRLLKAEGVGPAQDVFRFSLYYLAILFAAMVLDTFV